MVSLYVFTHIESFTKLKHSCNPVSIEVKAKNLTSCSAYAKTYYCMDATEVSRPSCMCEDLLCRVQLDWDLFLQILACLTRWLGSQLRKLKNLGMFN